MFQEVETFVHERFENEFPQYSSHLIAQHGLQQCEGMMMYKYYPIDKQGACISFERYDFINKVELVRMDGDPIDWDDFNFIELVLGKLILKLDPTLLSHHKGPAYACDISATLLSAFGQVYPNIHLVHDACLVRIQGTLHHSYSIRVTHTRLNNYGDVVTQTFPGLFSHTFLTTEFSYEHQQINVMPSQRNVVCTHVYLILDGQFTAKTISTINLQNHAYISNIPFIECDAMHTKTKTVLKIPVASQGILQIKKMDSLLFSLSFCKNKPQLFITGKFIFLVPTFFKFENWSLV